MNMIEVKTSELVGAALDWAVAKVEGLEVSIASCTPPGCKTRYYAYVKCPYKPSRDWSQGGPLIDKYRPDIQTNNDGQIAACLNNSLSDPDPLIIGRGDTYLIAACRAIVAAKLGDTVSIPAEIWRAEA